MILLSMLEKIHHNTERIDYYTWTEYGMGLTGSWNSTVNPFCNQFNLKNYLVIN